MSNKLYEEALADVRKLTEVAENNAKQAVLNAVVPRIQKLIENELLGTGSVDDMSAEDVLNDPDSIEDLGLDGAVSAPDQEGKVTLDLDALQVDQSTGDSEFELSMENKNTLKALKISRLSEKNDFDNKIKLVESNVSKLKANKNVTHEQISHMIEKVENMYEYVQESVDGKNKETFEQKLESIYKDLTNIQENMSKRNKKLNEDEQLDLDADASGEDLDLDSAGSDDDGDVGGELTLKLTGLPDGVDLDGIGVDLVGADADSGEDSGESDELDLDAGADEDGGDGDDEVLDLDLGGDDDVQGVQQESSRRSGRRLDENALVEIDENLLRKEIKRMAALRESAECDANGHGVDAKAMDDFGGGHDDGEPFLDGEVTTESEEDMLEGDEACDVSEVKDALKKESVLQRRLHSRMRSIKAEARGTRGRKLVELKSLFGNARKRFNESVKRANGLKKQLSESASHSRRSNSAVQRHTDNAVNQNLRKKLAESNLQSVKLAYANKVLQSNALNQRQRAQVIKALDECRTSREAKLVYTTVVKRLSAAQNNLREGKVIGSSSRSVRSGGSSGVVSEGFQTERWAKLAGIK